MLRLLLLSRYLMLLLLSAFTLVCRCIQSVALWYGLGCSLSIGLRCGTVKPAELSKQICNCVASSHRLWLRWLAWGTLAIVALHVVVRTVCMMVTLGTTIVHLVGVWLIPHRLLELSLNLLPANLRPTYKVSALNQLFR